MNLAQQAGLWTITDPINPTSQGSHSPESIRTTCLEVTPLPSEQKLVRGGPQKVSPPAVKHPLLLTVRAPVPGGAGGGGRGLGGQVLMLTGSREEAVIEHGAPSRPPSPPCPSVPRSCPALLILPTPLQEQQGARVALYLQPWELIPPALLAVLLG